MEGRSSNRRLVSAPEIYMCRWILEELEPPGALYLSAEAFPFQYFRRSDFDPVTPTFDLPALKRQERRGRRCVRGIVFVCSGYELSLRWWLSEMNKNEEMKKKMNHISSSVDYQGLICEQQSLEPNFSARATHVAQRQTGLCPSSSMKIKRVIFIIEVLISNCVGRGLLLCSCVCAVSVPLRLR